MNERYEVVEFAYSDGETVYKIIDNEIGKHIHFDDGSGRSVPFAIEFDFATNICERLNTECKQVNMSIAIMRAIGMKGEGINLCNEFNLLDLFEVLNWIANQWESYNSLHVEFSSWYKRNSISLLKMSIYEMQCNLVEKIYRLMKDEGLLL